MSKIFKTRHLPHRLFTKLIYSGANAPTNDFVLTRQVDLSQMAKSLKCSNGRILEALEFLSAIDWLTYAIEGKTAFITIRLPADTHNTKQP